MMVSAPQIIQHFDWWFWGSPKIFRRTYSPKARQFSDPKPFLHTWHPIPHAMASLGCAAWPVASATCHIMWLTFGNGCAQVEENEQPFLATSLCFSQFATHCSLKASTTSLDQYLHFAFRTFRLPSTKSRPPAVFPWAKGEKKMAPQDEKTRKKPRYNWRICWISSWGRLHFRPGNLICHPQPFGISSQRVCTCKRSHHQEKLHNFNNPVLLSSSGPCDIQKPTNKKPTVCH